MFFLYADELIKWSSNPLDNDALIGIYTGNGVYYYFIEANTPDTVNRITTTSNVNQPGLWIFKVDDYNIIAGVHGISL